MERERDRERESSSELESSTWDSMTMRERERERERAPPFTPLTDEASRWHVYGPALAFQASTCHVFPRLCGTVKLAPCAYRCTTGIFHRQEFLPLWSCNFVFPSSRWPHRDKTFCWAPSIAYFKGPVLDLGHVSCLRILEPKKVLLRRLQLGSFASGSWVALAVVVSPLGALHLYEN